MSPLNRTFRVSVVNGIGRFLNGATVTVYREGVPKVKGDIRGGPLDFQITGPGKIECEATYNGIHKKVEVQPSDNHIRIRIARWITMPKLAMAAVCLGILFVILLLNKGAVVVGTPEVRAEYVGPGTHAKPVVVVFVHGIFGDKKTWESQKTSFPELLTSDPEFEKNVDAFLFEYYSPRFGPGSNVNQLAKQLKAALEDKGVLRDHAQVVFLCHSMGGLITRRALLLIRDLRKVPMVYFYATPTNGADIAQLASKISSSPQLKSMLPLEGNEALQEVQDDWINWPATRTLPSYCAYETLPTDGVFVVTESSARALCNRLPEAMTANHVQIVKPPSRDDPRYTRFATALRETVIQQPGTPASPTKSNESARFAGTITDSATAMGLAGVQVRMKLGGPVMATTDSEGVYGFSLPTSPPDRVTLIYEANGHATLTEAVYPSEKLDFPLRPLH